jgi:diacylglycerol O-acyltransferase
MVAYDPLSAFDAQFLDWDSDATPMNMGNICIFEGGPLLGEDGAFRLEDVRRAIESRLHLVPRYRRKVLQVAGGFAHPVLVDDPDFDIANHVRLVRLDPPGSRRPSRAHTRGRSTTAGRCGRSPSSRACRTGASG